MVIGGKLIPFSQNNPTVKFDMKNLQQNLIHNFKRFFKRDKLNF
jgi:hypothetical protein